LLHVINEFNGFAARPDTISWVHSEDGRFTVNKLYKKEMGTQQGLRLARWKYVWTSQAPTKIKCFVWLVAKRAYLTHEVLQRKGVQLVPRCFLCNETNETNNHLFLHCRVTGQLWSLFLRLTGNSWTMPEHTADLLSCWIRRGGSKSQKKWWRIIPACIWWSVWKERNGRCYENKSNSIQKVKENCIAYLYFWCKQECIEEVEQLVDMLGSL